MTDQSLDDDTGDTEAHTLRWADAESAEGDDTEGHSGNYRFADAESTAPLAARWLS